MDALLHSPEIGIFLFLMLAIAGAQSFSKQFFKRNDKRLDVTPFETVLVNVPAECLGVCMFHDRCKAFNAAEDNCQLLDTDRCLASKELSHSPQTSYFDTISQLECPGKLWRLYIG